MKHAATQELFGYWDALRQGRAAPERADIDPVAIRGILSDTFVLEVGEDTRFPVRLSGTRLNALFGMELRGQDFCRLWAPGERADILDMLRIVLDEAMPMTAGVVARPAAQPGIDLEMVLLPLRHRGRTHARILGALAPFTMPSWLGLYEIDRLSLVSLRAVTPAPRDDLASRRESAERARTRRGHLTVLQGGPFESIR